MGAEVKKAAYCKEDHTFVVCAYGESPYLEACILSLLSQRKKGAILLATSTPNDHILAMARKYDIPVCVNRGESGLAGDWNFAMGCARTPLVTLAHQDDRYYEGYTEAVLEALNACSHPLIAHTDYNELRGGQTVRTNRLLRIKRLMLLPMRNPLLWGSIFVRRRILSLGSAICCPSVTLVKENLAGFAFRNNMKSNIDWQAWEEISRKKGEFAYVSTASMEHRIHGGSTTSTLLESDGRRREDLIVFEKFWPKWVARVIEWFYQRGEKSNEM